MKVKVLKGPIPVGFRYVKAGSIVELDDRVAGVMLKAGQVAKFEDEPKRRRVYRRRDAVPDQAAAMVVEPNDE